MFTIWIRDVVEDEATRYRTEVVTHGPILASMVQPMKAG